MDLSTLWHRAQESVLTRFFGLGEIREELARTGDRYLDARSWSRIRGVTEEEAERELLSGVKQGRFERRYLYEGGDAPAPFLVPESCLGTSVSLSAMGFLVADDREVEVSRYRTRQVFVSGQR